MSGTYFLMCLPSRGPPSSPSLSQGTSAMIPAYVSTSVSSPRCVPSATGLVTPPSSTDEGMPPCWVTRPHMTSPIYWFLWVLFRCLGSLLFSYRVQGHYQIPRTGGLLIAANHASVLDIPFLGCGIPRRVAFVGRHDLFPIRPLNRTLQALGWIPLRQDRWDRTALAQAERLIREGRAVVIFPEGARTSDGQLGPGRPGFAQIVANTGCPVLPVYISGGFAAMPIGVRWIRFHPIRVTFGEPVSFSLNHTGQARKEAYRYITAAVMARIAALRNEGDMDECLVTDGRSR